MSFDKVVLHLASPALCGIKPSCLFSMDEQTCRREFSRIKEWNKKLSEVGRRPCL